jgi:Flp pilus assembly pilin Flp
MLQADRMASPQGVRFVAGCGWRARFRRLLCEEHAATATEYAVMLALILLVIFVALQQYGQGLYDLYDAVNTQVPW